MQKSLHAGEFRKQLAATVRRRRGVEVQGMQDATSSGEPWPADDLVIGAFRSLDEFRWHEERHRDADAELDDIERQMILRRDGAFFVDGYCAVCRRRSQFQTGYLYSSTDPDTGQAVPNWREHLDCRSCGLVSRNRFVLHAVRDALMPRCGHRVYTTEQVTPLYRQLRASCPALVGSEYLGDAIGLGETRDGVRNEDVTRLTFPSGAFDLVVSCDVVQHVGRDDAAFAEFHRCLAPGGMLALTAPIALNSAHNIVRSRMDACGAIEHLVEPEYHGNPLGEDRSVLWFRAYGWELLTQLRGLGFDDVVLVTAWSRGLCYLGRRQIAMILATRG